MRGFEPLSYKEYINTFITGLVLSEDCTVMGTAWLKGVRLHHPHFITEVRKTQVTDLKVLLCFDYVHSYITVSDS